MDKPITPRQTIFYSFLLCSSSSANMWEHRTGGDFLCLQIWSSRTILSICSYSFLFLQQKKKHIKLRGGPKYVSIQNRQREVKTILDTERDYFFLSTTVFIVSSCKFKGFVTLYQMLCLNQEQFFEFGAIFGSHGKETSSVNSAVGNWSDSSYQKSISTV